MEDGTDMSTETREITINATWRSTVRVAVPDDVDLEEAIAAVNSGDFPDWIEFDSSTAELTDWEVAGG